MLAIEQLVNRAAARIIVPSTFIHRVLSPLGSGVLNAISSLTPGKFNSPHGLAADGDGNVYVAEWLIGGRYTQLKRVKEGSNS